jgi:hypothetical protein
MTAITNICVWGSWLWAGRPGMTCEAFSTDIHEAILDMMHDHEGPYPGDLWVLFTGEPGSQAFVPLEVTHERL